MIEPVVTERNEALREAFASVRYHGDMFAIHWRVCPARRRDVDCLKCHQLDLAASAAEDRLEALERGL